MSVYHLGPATALSPAQVSALWVNAGGDPSKAAIATGIVFGAENPAGDAGLVNDTPATGDYSVGLWQINYYGSLSATQTARFGPPDALAADPAAQARAVVAMSQNGTNWSPWGPDLGYSGYSKPVPGPLDGSKVANWIAANMPSSSSSATPAWVVPAAIGGLVLTAAGTAAAMILRFGPPPLPRFGFARERGPEPGGAGSTQRAMTVQSLLFPRSHYNVPEAKRWARAHLYRTDHVELTDKYIHLVQMPTTGLSVIRTIEFGSTGIKAHVGREAA